MNSNAYVNWMINQDRIKVLIRFYPWAVNEMHYAWPETCHYTEVFPDATLHESLFKLDSTLKPILSFAIVQLASLFEIYLGDRYTDALEERISEIPATELKLTDDYRIRISEFGTETKTYIAQERESFMEIRYWKKRLSKLMDDLGRRFPEPSDIRRIEEIMEIRNLLVHHAGKTTKRFQGLFPDSQYVLNGSVVVTKEAIDAMVGELQDFVYCRIEAE